VIVTVALLCASIVIVGWFHDKERPPNEKSIRPYMRHYVKLLNARDTGALRRHLHSRDAVVDAPARVAEFGGQGWTDVEVSYQSEFYGVYRIVLRAVRADTGAAVEVEEQVYWDHHATWQLSPRTVLPEDPNASDHGKKRSAVTPWPSNIPRPTLPRVAGPSTG
jgi:hypothetical protein